MKELIKTHKAMTIRFLIVGTVGFVVNYAVLKAVLMLNVHSTFAEIVAVIVALQVTFLLHDSWTYKLKLEETHRYKLMTRYFSYLSSNALSSALIVILFSLFALFLNHFYALLGAAFFGMIWNYIINKTVVWRHKSTN